MEGRTEEGNEMTKEKN